MIASIHSRKQGHEFGENPGRGHDDIRAVKVRCRIPGYRAEVAGSRPGLEREQRGSGNVPWKHCLVIPVEASVRDEADIQCWGAHATHTMALLQHGFELPQQMSKLDALCGSYRSSHRGK